MLGVHSFFQVALDQDSKTPSLYVSSRNRLHNTHQTLTAQSLALDGIRLSMANLKEGIVTGRQAVAHQH